MDHRVKGVRDCGFGGQGLGQDGDFWARAIRIAPTDPGQSGEQLVFDGACQKSAFDASPRQPS